MRVLLFDVFGTLVDISIYGESEPRARELESGAGEGSNAVRGRVEAARQICERAHANVARLSWPHISPALQVSISIGVAEVRGDESVEKFIKRLDEALYAAKHAGRNCTCYHDGEKCQPEAKSPGGP